MSLEMAPPEVDPRRRDSNGVSTYRKVTCAHAYVQLVEPAQNESHYSPPSNTP